MSNAIYFICNFLAKTKKLRYICSQIDFIISKTTINMKRINLWMPVAILICSLMMTGLSSCNDVADNPGNRDAQSRDVGYDVDNVKMVESRDVSIKEILEDIIVDHDDLETDEDLIYTEWGKEQLKDLQDDEQNTASTRAGLDGESGETKMGIKYVTIRYKTIGADGEETELSELIAYDKNAGGNDPTMNPKNLVIGCHCTITSDAERPTNFKKLDFNTDVNMLTLLSSSQKCLVVIPDYEGYGSTSSTAHPYCNRDVTAKQVIDGAKAAVVWFEANVAKLQSDWKTVAVGYSQGGAVAASIPSYYYANNLTGLDVIGAVCGDGPYDPLATLKQYIKEDRLYMPVAPALLLKGMVDTDKQLMALGCTYKDFVTDKFYNTGIFDWLKSKEYATDVIQTKLLEYSAKNGGESGFTMMAMYNNEFKAYIPENIKEGDKNWQLSNGKGVNYCTVDQCFKPEVIEYFKSGTITGDVPEAKLKALEQALEKNSLTYGSWKPSGAYPHAYHFFHSTRDEVVPFCNYESVKAAWGTNLFLGNPFESSFCYLHLGTGANFYVLRVINFTSNILNRKWAPGETK